MAIDTKADPVSRWAFEQIAIKLAGHGKSRAMIAQASLAHALCLNEQEHGTKQTVLLLRDCADLLEVLLHCRVN